MIHEIAPKRFWNAYEKREPQADSVVICVWNDSYCIIHEEQKDRFPRYEELTGWTKNKDDMAEPMALQYLFAILDGDRRRDYFLYVCENPIAKDDFHGFSYRNCEGTEQIRKQYECPSLPSYSWEKTYYINHKMKPRQEAFAGMTAHHLYVWYRDHRFCGRCGVEMVHDDTQRMMRCPSCGNMVYPRIAPAVLAAVQHDGKMLLTKYAHGDGNYALVAGFVEIGETAEECVAREVMEETGLRVKNVRYYDSQPWGFAGNLMLAYTAELDGEDDAIHRDEQELAVAEWVAPEEITDVFDYSSLTREMIRRFREGRL